jgi:hypothetical protein
MFAYDTPITPIDDWPLRQEHLITKTYQGEYDGTPGLETSVQMYASKQDRRFDTGAVEVYARMWNNDFQQQWVIGQPMFSIEAEDRDHDLGETGRIQGNRKNTRKTEQVSLSTDTAVTTLVSLPQLVALLHEASTELDTAIKEREQQPQQQARSCSVRVVKKPTVAIATARDTIMRRTEKEWYTDTKMWKIVVSGRCSAPYANIEYLKTHVRYVGMLMMEPDIMAERGMIRVFVGATGNVACQAYWGHAVAPGNRIGFIIRRVNDYGSPYTVIPWVGVAKEMPADDEVRFKDLSGATHYGLFFHIGTIIKVDELEKSRREQQKATLPKAASHSDIVYLGRFGHQVDPILAQSFTQTATRGTIISLGVSRKYICKCLKNSQYS